MKEYNKIETVFERDINGSKKLIEGKFRNPVVEYLKNNEWIFTEKIDGTNIRINWDGHKIIFSGRTDDSQIPSTLIAVLQSKFLNDETEQLFEQKFGGGTATLYCEGYGRKINKDGEKYGELNIVLFDVEVGETYLDRVNTEDVGKAFGIDCVPIILRGTVQEAIDYVKAKPKSTMAKVERFAEGLVGVPAVRLFDVKGDRVIIKIKARDFN